jgi:alkanesulfonate monooxygenase SsuD/methylene tetrahydromethanopterin reductase-like flavin-dependent oxidoreductase (luciferase family)
MDHLIQIPQVGRAWDPIPEPWVTLGHLAALDTELRLGTLVSPVTFHHAGVLAKQVATLDVLSGGRAFCGIGAGWFEREHAGFGLHLPPAAQRLDSLETTIETLRALWAPGTKAHVGKRVSLPETTCYPRPLGDVPILVGGSGARTLRIAGEMADACNISSDEDRLGGRIDTVRHHANAAGRSDDAVAITVLDVAVVGTSREDTARRVERLRGRTPAAAYAARHHAGEPAAHAARYERLREQGVSAVFLALPDLEGAEDLDRCAPLVGALR